MRRYHVNPESGVASECRARVKCRFGVSEEEHYSSKEVASRAFEEAQGSQVGESITDPLSILPAVHRDIPEKSDGFYNVTGTVDSEAIDAVAEYQHYRHVQFSSKGEEREWAKEQMLLAKEELQRTKGGCSWRGNKHDGESAGGQERVRVAFEQRVRGQELLGKDEVRRDSLGEEELVGYGWESREWVKELTPKEHNAVVYWTSAGSGLVGELAHGGKSKWGVQSSDPGGEEYFDAEEYLRVLDGALEKAPSSGSTVLHRGLSLDSVSDSRVERELFSESRAGTREWLAEEFPVGGVVSFKTPQSASRKPSVGRRFASSGVVLEVRSEKAGAPGVVSAWGLGEGEYILPRTTEYRVVDILENVEYEGRTGKVEELTVVQLEQVVEEN